MWYYLLQQKDSFLRPHLRYTISFPSRFSASFSYFFMLVFHFCISISCPRSASSFLPLSNLFLFFKLLYSIKYFFHLKLWRNFCCIAILCALFDFVEHIDDTGLSQTIMIFERFINLFCRHWSLWWNVVFWLSIFLHFPNYCFYL